MNDGAIVIVEDNPDDLELTLRALRHHHLSNQVVIARDGAEALEIVLGEEAQAPALILLDLKLPKLSGHEVLQALRRETRTALIPVVILTSSIEDEDVVMAYESGANSYVRKPVVFSDLIAAVQQLGLYWLLLNEPPRQSGSR